MITNIAQFKPTKEQREWVDKQVGATGESQATVMRSLIQEKVNKDKRKK